MATVQRYVNTASSGGDGTTNTTSGANAAYASLASWEANAGGVATDDYIVDCCGTAADTTGVTVDTAVNITTGSITIRGNRSDSAGFYDGPLVISAQHYRLSVGNVIIALTLIESNVTVDGIQIEHGHIGSGRGAIIPPSTPAYTIENCRLRNTGQTDYGIGTSSTNGGSVTRVIRNNLVVGFRIHGINARVTANFSPTYNIAHNTIYGNNGSGHGIYLQAPVGSGVATFNIYGNACANHGTGLDISTAAVLDLEAVLNFADNACEEAAGTADEIVLGTPASAWTAPANAATGDFSVKDTSSALYQGVNPTRVTTDITGYTRDGTAHDAGAFELVSSGFTGSVTSSLSAALSLARDLASSVDAAVQTSPATSSSIDAALAEANAVASSLDLANQQLRDAVSSLQAAVQSSPTTSTALEVAVQAAVTRTASLNTVVAQALAQIASADVAVRAARTTASSIEAYVLAGSTVSSSADLAVQRALSASASIEAMIQAATSITASMNAQVQAAQSVSASSSAAVQAARQAASSVDLSVQAARSAQAAIDAMVQGGSQVNALLSVAVRDTQTVTTAIGAALQLARSLTGSVQAAVSVAGSVAASLNAMVQASGTSVGALADVAVSHSGASAASIDTALAVARSAASNLNAVVAVAQQSNSNVSAAVSTGLSAVASLQAAVQRSRAATSSFDMYVSSGVDFVFGVLNRAWQRLRNLTWTVRKEVVDMPVYKTQAMEVLVDIDCSRELPAGVTFTGTPTLSASPSPSFRPIVFGVPALNPLPATYSTHVAPANTVVQVLVGGGVSRTPFNPYTIRMSCLTSRGDVWETLVELRVSDAAQ